MTFELRRALRKNFNKNKKLIILYNFNKSHPKFLCITPKIRVIQHFAEFSL